MLPAVLALIACGGQGGNAGPATNGDGSSSGGASDTDAGPSLRPSGGDSGALMAGEDSGGSSVGAEGGTGATGYGDAGGASEAGAAMDAGAGTYEPCPTDGTDCKILPLGDSITFGVQYAGAYRVELFHDALTDHRRITFVGDPSLANGPATVEGVGFPQNNQGHSGWRIDQITSLIPSPALQPTPHIILLHIGTNDVYYTTQPFSQAPQRLGALIDKIVAGAPNALLVVAQIIPLANGGGNMLIGTYNAAMPALVQARASAGKHVQLVDQHSGFQVATMMSSDGIHPNQTGYNHMGDVWYAAIKSVLR